MRAGELFVREMARWARLQNRANYPEVPEALLQEELQLAITVGHHIHQVTKAP